MTAIARAYTQDGFVIASDGLALASDTGEVRDTESQKIFCFGEAPHLSFSFVGSVRLGSFFNFTETIGRVMGSLKLDQYASLLEYTKAISYVLHKVLRERQRRGEIRFTETSSEAATSTGAFRIVYVLIDGYWGGVAGRVEVCFYRNQTVLEPEVLGVPLTLTSLEYMDRRR